MTTPGRSLRLLTALAARLLSPLAPSLPARLGLKRRGREEVAGVSGPVTVARDRGGVPFIRAGAPPDLFFGCGYAMAQDRLWQMDLYRRVAHGRLAELLGDRALPVRPGVPLQPTSVVHLDTLHRALGFTRVAAASYAILSSEAREALEGYTAGVNAAIAAMERQGALPLECALLGYDPEPWRPLDSLAIGRLIGWMLSFAPKVELTLGAFLGHSALASLLPASPPEGPCIVTSGMPLSGGGGGSNSWVVGGGRTKSGKPLLCNDPHLPMGLPCLFYQVGLRGGGYETVGATMPGIPAVVVGMNADGAWGMSSAMPDDADIYREVLHPTDPTLYAFRGEWRRLTVRTEEIVVRGKGVRKVAIRYIPRDRAECPLLSDLFPMGDTLSLRWTGLEPSREMDALLKINRARTLETFQEALRDFALPAQNFLYADRRGNIAYFCAGRFPQRKRGDGPFPLDGAKGVSEWEGDVPYDELPSEINPPSGLLVTANHRIVGEAYPHELSYLWEPPHRAQRILDLLEREGLGVADMATVQLDLLSLQAKGLVEGVIGPVFPGLHGGARQAAERLLRWDFRMGVESQEAALYHAFYDQIRRQLFANALNAIHPHLYEGYFSLLHLPVYPVDQILLKADPVWFPEGRGEVVARALEGAVRFLTERLGPEGAWRWGSLHPLLLRHPLGGGRDLGGRILERLFRLNRGPFPHPGDGMTVNVAAYPLSRPFEPLVGPVYRQIVDLESPRDSLWIIPGGSSGDPLSPHYSDQLEDWRQGRYHSMDPSPDAWQAILELSPAKRL